MSVLVFDWRNRQRNVEQGSVFAAPYRVVADDPLALAEPFDNSQLFIVALRRDQSGDRFADDFLSSVAEEPFRFFVPTGDHLIEIFADDRVAERLNDCSQTTIRFFGASALGDVAQICRENRRPIDLECRDSKLHPNLCTIPTQRLDLNQFSEQRAFASLQIMGQPLSMSFANPRWDNQFGQLLPDRFSARKAKHPLGRRIELPHPPGRVHGDDAIEGRVKEDAIERLQRCSWRTRHSVLLLLLSHHQGLRLLKRYKGFSDAKHIGLWSHGTTGLPKVKHGSLRYAVSEVYGIIQVALWHRLLSFAFNPCASRPHRSKREQTPYVRGAASLCNIYR